MRETKRILGSPMRSFRGKLRVPTAAAFPIRRWATQ
jgi:hypothetical protein